MGDYPKTKKDMKKGNKKKRHFMSDDDDEDSEYTDSNPALTNQVLAVLNRCDAADCEDAITSLDRLFDRFDDADSLTDIVKGIDQLQGKVDALEQSDDDSDDEHKDDADVVALLGRLDCETAAQAIIKLDGEQFINAHGHMLPKDFKLDGQELVELQKAAIAHCKPNLTLKNDSVDSVGAAFEVVAADNPAPAAGQPVRVDSSQQLDNALSPRQDMVHASLPSGAQRTTSSHMAQKPNPSVWNLSYQ